MATHFISLLVNNRPGVLAQVSELFWRLGCNIEQLSSRACKEPAIARMKIILSVEESKLANVTEHLAALMDVLQVKTGFRRKFLAATRLQDKWKANRTAAFWLVACSLFITLFGTNVPAPLYALYRSQWNLPSSVVTLLFAAYALVVIPTIIVSGPLSDRFGRKPVLISGVMFSLIGSLGFLMAEGPVMLVTSRMLQGLSIGMLNGVAVAAMTELDVKRSRTKAAFVATLAVTSGNALGPVLSGFLGELTPYPTRLPYLIHALFAFSCILGLLIVNENRKPAMDKLRLRLPSIPRSLLLPFYLSSTTSFIAWSVMSLVMSVIPTYIQLVIGKQNLIVSGGIVTLVLGFSACSQFLSKSRPLFPILTTGYALLALGLLGLTAALAVKSLSLLLLSTVLIGLGHGPSYSVSLAYINKSLPDTARAEIVSLYYVVTYVGVGIPILGLGFIAQWIGLIPAIAWFSCMLGIAISISLYMWKRHLGS